MGTHEYKLKNGKILKSVTTIIKDMEPHSKDYAFVREHLRKQGLHESYYADVGTLIHYRVLNSLSSIPLELPDLPYERYPDNADMLCNRAVAQFSALNLEFSEVICEKFGYIEDPGFCGTYDLYAKVTGKISDERSGTFPVKQKKILFDLKTSDEPKYPDYYLQLGGYSLLTPEMPEGAAIVCLPRPGKVPKPAKIWWISQGELAMYQNKFAGMCRDWWDKYGK